MPRLLFALSLLLGSIALSEASNLRFLDRTAPIRFFTEEDTRLFKQTLVQALNETRDGEKLAWKNTNTGAAGFIQPTLTAEILGQLCREVRVVNHANNQTAQSQWTFCKLGDTWEMSTESLESETPRK